MKQILHEINGIKYVLLEDIIYNEEDLYDQRDRAKKLGGFIQSVTDHKKDFWGETVHLKFQILIPEANAMNWFNNINTL